MINTIMQAKKVLISYKMPKLNKNKRLIRIFIKIKFAQTERNAYKFYNICKHI